LRKRFSDRCGIAQNFDGGDADDLVTFGPQPSIPAHVTFGIVAHLVQDSVDLDHQSPACAVEVHDEIPDRVMIAELYAEWSLAEVAPQHTLGQRHLAALFAGAID
jgi:hypothetical protein